MNMKADFQKKLTDLITQCKNPKLSERERTEYAEKAMKIAIKNNNKKAEVEINKIIGIMYFNNGNLKKSRIYLNRVLDIAIASEDQIEIAKAKRNLGSLLMEQHHFDDSLQYYFSAKEIYKSVNLTEDIVDINRLIGMIYYWKSEYQKALKIYKDCLENLDKRIKLSILTKSDLVLRDIDIFKKFKNRFTLRFSNAYCFAWYDGYLCNSK